MTSIQTKIRNIRNAHGFTQENMADALGISQRQYGRLENGESELTLQYIEKICNELKINPSELFTNEIKQENTNQSGGFANSAYLIINEFSEKLTEQYEQRLKDKDNEISFLRKIIENK